MSKRLEIIYLILFIIISIFFFYKDKIIGGTVFASLFLIFSLKSNNSKLKSVNIKEGSFEFYLPDEIREVITKSSDYISSSLNINNLQKTDIDLYHNIVLNNEVNLINDKEESICVNNLKDYKKYSKKGYYAYTTIDIGIASHYETLLRFLDLFKNYSNNYKKTGQNFKQLINKLSASFLNISFENKYLKNTTIEDLINSNDIIIDKIEEKKITLEIPDNIYPNTETYIINEIMRGDFSGNGIEEVFLAIFYHSAGTMHFETSALVSFHKNKWIEA